MQIGPSARHGGAGKGQCLVRLGGRIGGLAHHLASRADHALGLELGNCLAVLLPAPVDAATLVYGSRRPEELVQTVVEQRIVAVVLFGHLTGRWHPSQAGSALTVVLTG